MMLVLTLLILLLASIPLIGLVRNLPVYHRAPHAPARSEPLRVSVLIPARNEASGIADCVNRVLASQGVAFEVIVLDDRSTDDTRRIVRAMASRDPRVHLHVAPPLPRDWCGKQHASHVLAQHATHDRIVWIDADLRITPDALARACAYMDQSGADLVSGFPQQRCGTWAEALIVPLIDIVLLGYLPLRRMRTNNAPRLGAGCGQFFMTNRDAYHHVGGHAVIRSTLHDGIMLPRAYRAVGRTTDIFNAQDIAQCRMYHDARSVWQGFAKNATEGLATPLGIWFWSLLLLGGHVLPWLWPVLLLVTDHARQDSRLMPLALLALTPAVMSNVLAWWSFGHPTLALVLRPVGFALLMSIQWYAYLRKLLGQPVSWRGRGYLPE